MKPGIDPRVDYALKKVFGSESSTPILLDFLNAVLKPPPERRPAGERWNDLPRREPAATCRARGGPAETSMATRHSTATWSRRSA